MQGNEDHLMKSLDDLIAERKPKSHQHRFNQPNQFHKKGIQKNKSFDKPRGGFNSRGH